MPGLTYERAVDDDPDDPHDLHGGLPAPDVLHSLGERSLKLFFLPTNTFYAFYNDFFLALPDG